MTHYRRWCVLIILLLWGALLPVSVHAQSNYADARCNPDVEANLIDAARGRIADERQALEEAYRQTICQPVPQINIPGLLFTNLGDGNNPYLQEDLDSGDITIRVPFLGEYIAAVYQFAVIAASIFATIVIIVAGIQYMTAGSSQEQLSRAKKMLGNAMAGLTIALSSYAILYTINPNLVRFGNLNVSILQVGPYIGENEETFLAGVDYQPFAPPLSPVPLPPSVTLNTTGTCFPVTSESFNNSRATDNFGDHRRDGSGSGDRCPGTRSRCHAGTDIYTNPPGHVVAVADGEIIGIERRMSRCRDGWGAEPAHAHPGDAISGSSGSYRGWGLVIRHPSLDNMVFHYGELDKFSVEELNFEVGDRVSRGQILGRAGYCGMLHLEIYDGDRYNVSEGPVTLDWCPAPGISITRDNQCRIYLDGAGYGPNGLLDSVPIIERLKGGGSGYCRAQPAGTGSSVSRNTVSISRDQFISFVDVFTQDPSVDDTYRPDFEKAGGIHIYAGDYPQNEVDVFLLFHGVNGPRRSGGEAAGCNGTRSFFEGTNERVFDEILPDHIAAGGVPVILVELIGCNYRSYEDITQANFNKMLDFVEAQVLALGFDRVSWNVLTQSRSTGSTDVQDFIDGSRISRLNLVLRGESTYNGNELDDPRLSRQMEWFANRSNHTILFNASSNFDNVCTTRGGEARWQYRDVYACRNMANNPSQYPGAECYEASRTLYWEPGERVRHANVPNEVFAYALNRFFRGNRAFTDQYRSRSLPSEYFSEPAPGSHRACNY